MAMIRPAPAYKKFKRYFATAQPEAPPGTAETRRWTLRASCAGQRADTAWLERMRSRRAGREGLQERAGPGDEAQETRLALPW